MGWHGPPSRSPAPRRRRGRRTGSEKARVLSRLLASYSVQAFRIRLVIVSLARRPSSCLGLLSPPGLRSILLRPSTLKEPASAQPSPAATLRFPRGAMSPNGRGAGRAGSGSHTHLGISRECQLEPVSLARTRGGRRRVPLPSALWWRRGTGYCETHFRPVCISPFSKLPS